MECRPILTHSCVTDAFTDTESRLFKLLSIVIGVQLLLTFLFVPETTYLRDPRYNTDETANVDLEELAKIEHRHREVVDQAHTNDEKLTRTETSVVPKKKSWVQELKVFNGIQSDEPVWAIFAAPLISCTNIAVLWMVVISGTVTSFYVAQSYIAAQIFAAPPYLLTTSEVGYTFLGPFIGGVIGTAVVGSISDFVALKLTKLNNGVYEPEFRLVPIIIGLTSGIGYFGFGYVTADQQSVYTASFLWGLCIFGVTFVAVGQANYIMDAYRDLSHEAFIAAMIFKNYLFYGYSYFINDWIASVGPAPPYYIFGSISLGMVFTIVPVFMWGKKYRSFWFKHNVFKKLNIRSQAEM